MAYFSKFKIGNTSYDVKDANAGKTIALNGNTLQLKNAAGTVVSSVTLPGGGGGGAKVFFANFSAPLVVDSWNNTNITCTGLYDGEGNQASWADVSNESIVYGIFTCGDDPYDHDVYIVPLTQDNQEAAPNLKAFRAIVLGDTNNDIVPAKLGFFYGEYNTQAEQWVTGPTGTAAELGGGGAVVYDVYDGSGQAMISTGNIQPSGNVILMNGSTAVHASDINPTGSYILNFTDCAIPVDNIETYNKAMILNALVQGTAFKVRFVNQWGDNWEYTKYN